MPWETLEERFDNRMLAKFAEDEVAEKKEGRREEEEAQEKQIDRIRKTKP